MLAARAARPKSNSVEFFGSVSSGVENISLLIGCCSMLAVCSVQSELGFRLYGSGTQDAAT